MVWRDGKKLAALAEEPVLSAQDPRQITQSHLKPQAQGI